MIGRIRSGREPHVGRVGIDYYRKRMVSTQARDVLLKEHQGGQAAALMLEVWHVVRNYLVSTVTSTCAWTMICPRLNSPSSTAGAEPEGAASCITFWDWLMYCPRLFQCP